MTYTRPEFGSTSVKTQTVSTPFMPGSYEVPVFDAPVNAVDNFMMAARRQTPYWLPNALTDFQTLMTHDVAGRSPKEGMQIHSDINRVATEDYFFEDWFGTSWTWVHSAGGAMLTPGTQLLGDITDWERDVIWPDFTQWGFEEKAQQWMRDKYDPNKVMRYDFGRGVTERLVSLMGGYTESMMALALEPEAVLDFFERYIDFLISFFDLIYSLYPLQMVTLHDDWGTERDTFFSEKMMEDLVFAPTKRFVDYVKARGIVFELHSCGNVTRFVPYAIDMGTDFLQIQRRAVDIPALKLKYGDKIGFNAPLEGIVPGKAYSDDEAINAVRKSVDVYGRSGGAYMGVFFPDAKQIWKATSELFAYSREYYDSERK